MKPCGKCVYVKLSLSVNCENFWWIDFWFFFGCFVLVFYVFIFPLLKLALSSLGVCLHPVCSNCLTFLLVSKETCDAFRPGHICSTADSSGMVRTHLRHVGVDEWLFRSVFFMLFMLEVIKCGSAPAQLISADHFFNLCVILELLLFILSLMF